MQNAITLKSVTDTKNFSSLFSNYIPKILILQQSLMLIPIEFPSIKRNDMNSWIIYCISLFQPQIVYEINI